MLRLDLVKEWSDETTISEPIAAPDLQTPAYYGVGQSRSEVGQEAATRPELP